MILASGPASSSIQNTPTGRAAIQQPGEGGLLQDHEGVERVAVLAEGVGDEAVVGRVDGGREQAAVEPDHAGLVVDLVLVAAAAGDLDDDVDGLGAGASRSHGSS